MTSSAHESETADPRLVLRALAEATTDLVYVLSCDGRYTFVNEPGARVHSLRPEEMIGRHVADVGLAIDRAAFDAEREEVMRTGVPSRREVTVTIAGEPRTFEYVLSPLHDEQRVTHGVISVARDITARANADAELLDQLRFREAIERSLAPGLLTLALDGRITWASPSAVQMFGWSFDELLTFSPPYPFWPPEEIPRIFALYAATMASAETPPPLDLIFRRRNEERFPITMQPAPLLDENGGVIGWLAIVTDVSKAERRYRDLADAMPQIVWSARADGYTDYFNSRWYEFTGFERGAAGDAGWEPILHPDDVQHTKERWRNAVESGQPYDIEYRFFDRSTGTYRWHLGRALPVLDDQGRVLRWHGTCTDIDDLKRADEASEILADASALLTASLDPNTILSRLADLAVPRLADWCAIDVALENAPHQRLTIAHLDREKAAMIMEIDRDYRMPADVDPVAEVLASGEPSLIENIDTGFVESLAIDARHLEIIRSLGIRSCVIVPIVTGGRTYATLTLVHAESGRRFSERDLPFLEDLTSRVGVAVQNALLYVQAQAANRAKDEFLATLSHELRTPMTTIVGWARMLELGGLEPEVMQTAFEAISRGAKVQAQLIDDILDVSRITLGKLHLTFEDVGVNEIVSAAIDAVRATANVKTIAIETHLDPRRPFVAGDANRLQQVVWNLVNNAVKFTPSGGRVAVAVDSDDGNVRIRVADTGEGIAEEFLPHIFDRFRQADSSTTRRFGGLGLGLAIVKQITELHGGVAEATSAGRGLGATFTITLPLVRAEASEATSEAPPAMPELRGTDILVVDDDAQTRRFIVAALEHAGASVRDASSVRDALAAVRAKVPSVLVTDIAMPDRDGFSLLEEVRTVLHIDDARMPAVAITAFAGPQDRVRVLAAGFQRYILKPLDPVQLARVVAEVV